MLTSVSRNCFLVRSPRPHSRSSFDKRSYRMNPRSNEALFLQELKEIYSAEKQFLRALPKMVATVRGEPRRAALRTTMSTIKQHVARLSVIRKDFGINLRGWTSEVAKTLLEQGCKAEECAAVSAREAGLVAVAQRMQNYQISRYTAARELASLLGLDEATLLLSLTLKEKQADEDRLLQMACHQAEPCGVALMAVSDASYDGTSMLPRAAAPWDRS